MTKTAAERQEAHWARYRDIGMRERPLDGRRICPLCEAHGSFYINKTIRVCNMCFGDGWYSPNTQFRDAKYRALCPYLANIPLDLHILQSVVHNASKTIYVLATSMSGDKVRLISRDNGQTYCDVTDEMKSV